MHAVVLTFDRLPAHFLGCYGNEWIETPSFDALAAGSTVFERHFVEIPGQAGASHPWWTGRFEFFDRPAGQSLFENLEKHGVRCRMLSERNEGLPDAGLSSRQHVTGEHALDSAHDDVAFARLVIEGKAAIENLEAGKPELLWLHSEGVPTPWLPPEFFAGLYLDELEDRLDGTGVELAGDVIAQLRADPVLAELLLSEPSDEDADDEIGLSLLEEAFGETAVAISRFVFGGYVSLIDHWLQKLTDALSAPASDLLFILTAAGGYSFGEQNALLQDAGLRDSDLAGGELGDQILQTPLILWQPAAKPEGIRVRSLAQPPEIAATLLDWFGAPQSEAASGISLLRSAMMTRSELQTIESSLLHSATPRSQHQLIEGNVLTRGRDVSVHFGESGEVGLQDDHWFLAANRADLDSDTDVDAIPARLYAKPEDVWEVNNMADQSPDVCQRLLGLLREKLAMRQGPTGD